MKTKLFYIVPTALVMSAYAEDYINEPQAQKLIFPSSTEFIKKTIQLSDDQVDKIKSNIENSHRIFSNIRDNFNKADTVLNTSQSLDYDLPENTDINFNQTEESKKDLFKPFALFRANIKPSSFSVNLTATPSLEIIF